MTAVVVVQVVDVLLAINLTLVFLVFRLNKFCKAELRCEYVRERNDSRYEQFEISPEMSEQELRPVVCEQRQTDREL